MITSPPEMQKTHPNVQDTVEYLQISHFTRTGQVHGSEPCTVTGHEMHRGEFINPSPPRPARSISHPMKALMRRATESLCLHRNVTVGFIPPRRLLRAGRVSHGGKTKPFQTGSAHGYAWRTGDGAAHSKALASAPCGVSLEVALHSSRPTLRVYG